MPATSAEQDSRSQFLHPSSMSTMLGCPRRWFLEYKLRLPLPSKASTIAGTAFHAAAEEHEIRRSADGSLMSEGDMLDFARGVLRELIEDCDEQAIEKAGGAGIFHDETEAAVQNFWQAKLVGFEDDSYTPRDWLLLHETIATELYVNAPITEGAPNGAGTMDLVLRDPLGNLLIGDWKTAGSSGMSMWNNEKKLVEKRTPGAVYGWCLWNDPALQAKLGITVDGLLPMSNVVIRRQLGSTKRFVGARLVRMEYNANDLRVLGGQVRRAASILELGAFPPDNTYEWCRTCPFQHPCQGTGELAVAAETLLARFR